MIYYILYSIFSKCDQMCIHGIAIADWVANWLPMYLHVPTCAYPKDKGSDWSGSCMQVLQSTSTWSAQHQIHDPNLLTSCHPYEQCWKSFVLWWVSPLVSGFPPINGWIVILPAGTSSACVSPLYSHQQPSVFHLHHCRQFPARRSDSSSAVQSSWLSRHTSELLQSFRSLTVMGSPGNLETTKPFAVSSCKNQKDS